MDSVDRDRVKLAVAGTKADKVRNVMDQFYLSDSTMSKAMKVMTEEMRYGLSADENTRKKTSLQMENTYVRSLLDGTEEGDFLALDLGGTNFRVLLCRMRKGKCDSISKNYNVPNEKLHGPAKGVFDHLAESISKFLTEENLTDRRLSLGFTFSFPMVQEALNKGILITWTKSFACPDGVGQDAVQLLEEAIARRGDIAIDVVAVLNDTTGTLMAGSYLDKQCYIGMVLGTGFNLAYMENVDKVDKWTGPKGTHKEVAIDSEWGAYGDNGCLDFVKTEYDRVVDRHSNHVGSFTFEKYFAGHYIGDTARLTLLRLAADVALFDGNVPESLQAWGSFTTENISDIEKDTDLDVSNTKRILKEFGLDNESSDDINIIRYICSMLSIRTAQLVCATMAVVLNNMGRPEVTVAIDGSLYRYHPNLHNMMTGLVKSLVPTIKTKLILAEDGSGRGAAFVAAVAERLKQGDGV